MILYSFLLCAYIHLAFLLSFLPLNLTCFHPAVLPSLLAVCSLMFLQLHGSIGDFVVPKLPRGVWEQLELCVADNL